MKTKTIHDLANLLLSLTQCYNDICLFYVKIHSQNEIDYLINLLKVTDRTIIIIN